VPEPCVFSLKVNQLREVLSVCFCQPSPVPMSGLWLKMLCWVGPQEAVQVTSRKQAGREGQRLTDRHSRQVARNLNPPLTENTLGDTVAEAKREPRELKQAA